MSERSYSPMFHRRYCQALSNSRNGRYAEAVRLLDAVLTEDPAYLPARIHRAKACALSGQVERAVEDLTHVLGQDEGHLEARLNLAGLYVLLGLYGDAEIHFRLALLNVAAEEWVATHLPPVATVAPAALSSYGRN